MTKIIGLTGGIGSGKSTIAQYFQTMGIPVYIADDEARKISESPETIEFIRQQFGNNIFDGEVLNRQRLASIVFEDPKQLIKLNAIIHPQVQHHFNLWLQNHKQKPFVIKEAAILFESGSYKDCDKIITITALEETRIQRVMKRDQLSYQEVIFRIRNQWSDEQRIAKSDFVIDNFDFNDSKRQANEILKKLTI